MIEHITKPSPKIISFGIVALAIVCAVVLLKLPAREPVVPEKTAQVRPFTRNVVTEVDSDGDGLKDWEESLWKTDPYLVDTDGDGVSDKEEAVQYQIQQAEIQKTTLEEVQKILLEQAQLLSSGEITASEAASRGLVAQYFLFKESGLEITPESVATFTSGLTQNVVKPPVYTTYTANDILLSPESGADAVRKYGNAVGTILSSVVGPEVPHELLVFVQFEETGDVTTFQKNMKIIDARYEYTITNLLSTRTPKETASVHLNLLNALSKTRADLQKMANLSGDAVESMLAFKEYEKNSVAIAKAFTQMRTIFNSMRVIFNKTDPGYVITIQS